MMLEGLREALWVPKHAHWTWKATFAMSYLSIAIGVCAIVLSFR